MKTRDLLTITSAAVATAALTVATFGGGSMNADNDADSATKIAQPKLALHGVDLTLATADARVFKAGDEPVLELKAVNTTDQPAEVSVDLNMTASNLRDLMSRVARPMPAFFWQSRQTLTLKANETKTISLATKSALPTNSIINVRLMDANPSATPLVVNSYQFGITALSFSTLTNNQLAAQFNLVPAQGNLIIAQPNLTVAQ